MEIGRKSDGTEVECVCVFVPTFWSISARVRSLGVLTVVGRGR